MDVNCVAVIGAGAIGRAIACAALAAGYNTILEDVSENRLDQAVVWIRQTLDKAVVEGKIAPKVRDVAVNDLSAASSVEDVLRSADLIIETLPEEMEMKLELFTLFDKFAKPNAIFASTTHSLSISEMAEITFCADRCIGMRFADPLREESLLELVRAPETSEATIAVCTEVGHRLAKNVVVVPESQGQQIPSK
jgi:3-hydroxybutyryl-CoA dehydrogenase